jgi:hypothetical protein
MRPQREAGSSFDLQSFGFMYPLFFDDVCEHNIALSLVKRQSASNISIPRETSADYKIPTYSGTRRLVEIGTCSPLAHDRLFCEVRSPKKF